MAFALGPNGIVGANVMNSGYTQLLQFDGCKWTPFGGGQLFNGQVLTMVFNGACPRCVQRTRSMLTYTVRGARRVDPVRGWAVHEGGLHDRLLAGHVQRLRLVLCTSFDVWCRCFWCLRVSAAMLMAGLPQVGSSPSNQGVYYGILTTAVVMDMSILDSRVRRVRLPRSFRLRADACACREKAARWWAVRRCGQQRASVVDRHLLRTQLCARCGHVRHCVAF